MEAFARLLQNLGLTKLIVLSAVLVGVGWGAMQFVNHVSTPDMALLYGDLDQGDAGRIVAKLEDQGVNVQIGGGGTQVYVPIDMVARLRMDMAESGLPNGGSVGYEIFDRSDVFGSSFFVQNLNHVRALEGELARTIRTIAQVASARVHLVLPKRDLFSAEKQEPSASIVLRLHSAGRMDSARVQAIQHLVAAAVPKLSPDAVSVVDDRGNLLSSTGDREHAVSMFAEEMRVKFEQRLERAIVSLLERTLGPGKIRAQVAADMDFDRMTENSEIYDPEGQVARSTQTVTEDSQSSESEASNAATVTNELPEGEADTGSGQSKNDSKRSEEIVNYEITKTIRSHIKESGAVKKMSVAVLVDGAGGVGEEEYKERSKEELDQIAKLVKTAIGFDEKRGDKLEVINMRFHKTTAEEGELVDNTIMGFERHHIVRIAETLILALMGILALLLVVKPLIQRLTESMLPEEKVEDKPAIANDDGSGQGAVVTGTTAALNAPGQGPPQDTPAVGSAEDMIRMDNVEGEVSASNMNKVTGLIDDHIDETVSTIRSWMSE
ncbi:MAG: flagellar basal-body MS-ring/collar protein FliF [Alphaproteobacteria bacterium]